MNRQTDIKGKNVKTIPNCSSLERTDKKDNSQIFPILRRLNIEATMTCSSNDASENYTSTASLKPVFNLQEHPRSPPVFLWGKFFGL